jgi:hypothetical protein
MHAKLGNQTLVNVEPPDTGVKVEPKVVPSEEIIFKA